MPEYTSAVVAAPSLPTNLTPPFRLDQLSTPVRRKSNGRQLDFVTNSEMSRTDIVLESRHNVKPSTVVKKKSSERVPGRGRQNSLRHVKNSTEVLRQRSRKRAAKDAGLDGNSGTREGRQFTVANVGNNGMIYLRPIERQPHKTPQVSAFTVPLVIPSTDAANIAKPSNEQWRASTWSDTQGSKTPTRPRHTTPTRNTTQGSISTSRQSTSLARTHSPSDAESHAGADNLDPGAFKVVITHPTATTLDPQEVPLPSLQVPIPHYRLGSPRFSARGTAFLHSSVYTRTSTDEDIRSSTLSGPEYDQLFPAPPGMEPRPMLSRRHSHASSQPFSVQISPAGEKAAIPVVTSSPAFHRAKEPIVPTIFDTLALNLDDPAIVRYSPSTGEITAGSAARIIAQITSKNFLDYELLSDFFLTVRAYLSTHDLLAYLLARFEWAVNRFDDDGRVIRVRAFAALRHWILNYFPYDFVVDRDLRVKFCERLNAMSRHVRDRPIHGPSDLKLILDLKKCWNGRCSLYWDNPQMDAGGRHDLDISPGGIAGSRDSQLTHPSQLWGRSADTTPPQIIAALDPELSVSALNNWFDAVQEAGQSLSKGHERQISIATSRSLPTSPISEQSIQAMSCTIPAKGLKKLVAQANRSEGARPVPASMSAQKICPAAPSAMSNDKPRLAKHGHKRSGSFSDAVRDKRTSMPTMTAKSSEEHVMLSFPYSGSLIRGSVIPPGSPYVDDFAPTTPLLEMSNLFAHDSDSDIPYHSKPMSPGVKNLLGSIRRAWTSKQSSAHQSNQSLWSGPFASSVGGYKSSSLPLNVAYQDDGNLDRNQLEALKKHDRIDLLCADVTEQFKRALIRESKDLSQTVSSIDMALATGLERDMQGARELIGISQNDPVLRQRSQVTNGSKSIVIMDDTGMNQPLPDLPIRSNPSVVEEHLHEVERAPAGTTLATIASALPASGNGADIPTQYPTDPLQNVSTSSNPLQPFTFPNSNPEHQVFGSTKDTNSSVRSHRPGPSTNSQARSYRSTNSGTRSLRKYASYQSGMTRNPPDHSFDATTVSLSPPWSSNDVPPARLLRRRPGGDLRANENVHDLEQLPRSRSTGSITTCTDSMRGSGLYINRALRNTFKTSEINEPAASDPVQVQSEKPPSLVRTHSSQPASRPSFEAAIAKFARIPDDDGGGIEATLLKLEGKYRRSPVEPLPPQPPEQGKSFEDIATPRVSVQDHNQDGAAYGSPGYPSVVVSEEEITHSIDDDLDRRQTITLSLYAESEESYNSVPLLERGLSSHTKKRDNVPSSHSKVSMPQPLFSPSHSPHRRLSGFPLPSPDELRETYSSSRIRYRSSIPTTTDSFLLDEDEFLSDLSSELSVELLDQDELSDRGPTQFYQQAGVDPNKGSAKLSPLHPPSPPMTTENAKAIAAQADKIQNQRRPPTPEPSPISRHVEPATGSTSKTFNSPASQLSEIPATTFSNHRHLPFVLAFSSEILAEQFTIIEKDALNEINWKDLIDMRWNHTSPSTLNWVEYLRGQESSGIELVTARFNIVVKWVLSEIVLTQSMEERALCIIKYIHIAMHARRIHNYATLLQLTIALTSIDCSRLKRTWELVPTAEKKALDDLETLVTPFKNFHNLRQEMETANAEEGCIPVVALYTHDLTYNSQKPSQIASTRDGEPLINFERYRTTATIVKSLLRLIDASAKYAFQPVEDALTRCLWMACLSDDTIRMKSKELE